MAHCYDNWPMTPDRLECLCRNLISGEATLVARAPFKVTACFLQAIMALCIGLPANAQSNRPNRAATRSAGIHNPPPAVGYQRWLDQDVRWIISDDERSAFLRLSKDEDRDEFIEHFWQRRDPMPGAPVNEFKVEHYRRIAYANIHFAQALPGWKTDRGRTYIVFGPPDEVKVEAAHNNGEFATPTEVWHYSIRPSDPDYLCQKYFESSPATSLEALRTCLRVSQGYAMDLKFVDACRCGDYRLRGDFE
jgi:GWxTD domain-containing protein